jgi:hypothetical protein
MSVVLRDGWELNDPSISSNQFKATIPATTISGAEKGSSAKLGVVNNTKSGSFDLYNLTIFGFGEPFASYSASENKLIPLNQETFDLFFAQNTKEGSDQLKTIVDSVKIATYDLAQINTGTDPVSNRDFSNLQQLNGYKSLANQAPPGQRLPDGQTPPLGANPAVDPTTQTYNQEEIGKATSLSLPTTFKSNDIVSILGGPGPIIYPTNLGSNGQDFIEFEMVEYEKREFQSPVGSGVTSFKIPPRNTTARLLSVYLPIQPSINDQNDIGWGEDKMTAIQASLANIATQGSSQVLSAEIDKAAELFGNNSEYGKLLRRYFGGQAVGINPIARTDGLVLNPNLELLFSGPSLRPFNFTFRLSPRDSTEATTVKKIIKFFKLGSTVRTTNDGLFLKAPYVFNIKYKFKDSSTEHPGLNKIKTCALRTISVNYTPDGSYMTFEDGTMTSYEIALQFSELEPVYDSDYKNNKSHPIGY